MQKDLSEWVNIDAYKFNSEQKDTMRGIKVESTNWVFGGKLVQ